MRNILITGVNRGIGLGLIKNLIKTSNYRNIIGTCRNIEKAQELLELTSKHRNLHILTLDVKDTENFAGFAEKVEEIVKDEGLHLLVNNAGVAPKSTRIGALKTEQLTETYLVNVVGPIMLTKALLPVLRKAKNSNPAVVNVTSILGSISQNKEGGLYPYRCSKAALNMATKSLSLDLKNDGISVTCLHPGWVKTDMGGPGAPLTVDESVDQIVRFFENLNDGHSGNFYQYDGKKLEW